MREFTDDEQVSLVRTYFRAVDEEDLEAVLATLTDDCHFSVETHGVLLMRHADISSMFQRLWANHKAVRHTDFRFVCDPRASRITAQFKVQNTELDGSLTHKSNCNVFDIREGRFSRIAVYMAGPNTLDRN